MECDPVDIVYSCLLENINNENIKTIDADHLYNDVSPNREWDGTATVEIGREDTQPTYCLDGSVYYDTTLIIAIKGSNKNEAKTIDAELDDFVSLALLEAKFIENGVIDAAVEDVDIFPDTEGTTVREEYWYVTKITVTHF